MRYRTKKIFSLIGAAAIFSASVTACADEKNETSAKTDADSQKGIFSYDEMFTERDLEIGYEEDGAVKISLQDDAVEITDGDGEEPTNSGVTAADNIITIASEGTYIFSGALTDGSIVVDADDEKVRIVLDGVDISCEGSAPIYVKKADKVFVTLAAESENSLKSTGEYESDDDNNVDAAIFSKDDLTINGNGALTIASECGHGIVSKDDLKLTGGTYTITAQKHALSANDSVRIAGGTYNIVSEKDAIHVDNDEDNDKGYVYIADAYIDAAASGDGIDASYVVQIEDGTYNIKTGGGAAESTITHNDMMPGNFGGAGQQMPDKEFDGDMSEAPEMPNRGDDGKMSEPPQMPGKGSDGEMQEPPQMPDNETGGEMQELPQTSDNESTEDDQTDTVSTKGIKADGAIYINGGTFSIDSADDSIHSNTEVTINGGEYTLTSGDDGIHADEALLINAGTINIGQCYEGLEGITVTINDGDIDITASDDGINAAGGNSTGGFGPMNQDSDECWMEINGGNIHVLAGGDGLDSNGNLTINGGELYVDGPSDNGNSAIDYGDRAECFINGGVVVAVGSSGMAEEISSDSKQQVIFVKLDSRQEAGEVTLSDDSGEQILSYTAQKTYDCVIISTPELTKSESYTLNASGNESKVEL